MKNKIDNIEFLEDGFRVHYSDEVDVIDETMVAQLENSIILMLSRQWSYQDIFKLTLLLVQANSKRFRDDMINKMKNNESFDWEKDIFGL